LKFIVETGADISLVGDVILKLERDFKSDYAAEVKGTSSAIMTNMGTVNLRLYTDTHETTHDFHVIGDTFQLQYGGILGKRRRQSSATLT
jgi:hypothetical protein